jgi:hypothetical protein
MADVLGAVFGLDKHGDDERAVAAELSKLVHSTYGNDYDTINSVAVPALQLVLGVDLSRRHKYVYNHGLAHCVHTDFSLVVVVMLCVAMMFGAYRLQLCTNSTTLHSVEI